MSNVQTKTRMRANFYKKTIKCFKIILAMELQQAWQLDTMLIRYEQYEPDYFISLAEMVKLLPAFIYHFL